jgi:hypothetical protein
MTLGEGDAHSHADETFVYMPVRCSPLTRFFPGAGTKALSGNKQSFAAVFVLTVATVTFQNLVSG